MFVTDAHVLIEMNKCGSSYGGQLMRDTCGGERVTKTRHAPIRGLLPEYRKGRRVIGMVRNPFAWYVSGWNSRRWNMCRVGQVPITFDAWFADINKIPWRYLAAEYRPQPASHISFSAYTFFHLNFYLPEALRVFADYRSMTEVERDYDSLLDVDDWVYAHRYYQDFEYILGRPLVRISGTNRNAHGHGPFQDYISPDKRAFIERNDAFLLDRYEHSWDGPEYRLQEVPTVEAAI